MQKLGLFCERVCKKYYAINFVDRLIERVVDVRSSNVRDNRRYKTFVGSSLIARSKCKEILAFADVKDASRILEFGCGDARLLLTLGKKLGSKEIFGVDIDQRRDFSGLMENYPQLRLFHMDRKNPHYNPNGKISESGTPKVLHDATFDFIYLYDVITYLRYNDFLKLFGELRELLSEHGKIWFNIPVLSASEAKNYNYLGDGEIQNNRVGTGGEFVQYFWDEALVKKFLNSNNSPVSHYPMGTFKNNSTAKNTNFVVGR